MVTAEGWGEQNAGGTDPVNARAIHCGSKDFTGEDFDPQPPCLQRKQTSWFGRQQTAHQHPPLDVTFYMQGLQLACHSWLVLVALAEWKKRQHTHSPIIRHVSMKSLYSLNIIVIVTFRSYIAKCQLSTLSWLHNSKFFSTTHLVWKRNPIHSLIEYLNNLFIPARHKECCPNNIDSLHLEPPQRL